MISIERPVRFFTFVIIVVALVGALSAGTAQTIWGNTTLQQDGELTISEGATAEQVWKNFVAEGFTAKTTPWRYYSWRLRAASRLQSGTYQLEEGEHVRSVINRLTTGDTTLDELTITYPEGFTLQQVAARTAARNIGTLEDFIAAAKPGNFVDQFPYLIDIKRPDLEGYLFPDTYKVFPDDAPADVIQRMLTNLDAKFTADMRAEAQAQGRTLDQIVIMASIIEREVTSDEDMAIVSGVLWKRFDEGIGLAADATVRYALDKWDAPLTFQDLQSDSPYNTRKWRGLPPGPISNPGLRALVAAVRPEPSEFYYYLSAPSGETIFSRNLDEHNANKAKHLR